MRIDLKKYEVNRRFIQDFYDNNKENYHNLGTMIAICSGATHCPSIVMCFYLADHIGFTTELIKIIDGFIEYYGYSSIIGQSDNSPYSRYDI